MRCHSGIQWKGFQQECRGQKDVRILDPQINCAEQLEKNDRICNSNKQGVTYKYDLPNSRVRTNWPGAVGMMQATAGFETV